MKRIFILWTLIVFMLFCFSASASETSQTITTETTGQIIYVDSTKNGDGSSWADAYGDLVTALDSAEAGDQIWVVQGIYTPNNNENTTFQMKDDVAVYGGFDGTETELSDRDYESNVTILSGALADGQYATHVVIAANNLLDGFTISDGNSMAQQMDPMMQGNAESAMDPLNMGGEQSLPMDAPDQTQPMNMGGEQSQPIDAPDQMANDQMQAQSQSGGMSLGHSSPDQVTSGTALTSSAGAGIIIWECAPTIQNCIITNNQASKAGGVYINNVSEADGIPTFVNCMISNNYALTRGGGVSIDMFSEAYFIDCVFDSNECSSKGGAIYDDFGGSPLLYNCLFVNNVASEAAAIGNDGVSNPKIIQCTFANNVAYEAGAALYQGTGPYNDPIVMDTIIYGNVCENDVADVYNWNESNTVITYSLVESGYEGEGNISVDPAFDSNYVATSTECLTASSTGATIGYLGTTTQNADEIMEMLSLIEDTPEPTVLDLTNPITSTTFDGEVIYVSTDANGEGTSFSDTTDLQNAINIAGALYSQTGETIQIWVQSGTYTPGDLRSDSFVLQAGVELYGGFDGTETTLSDRDSTQNETILSGEIGDLTIATDNCYHVMIGADHVILDGFTITGGYADGVDGEVYDQKGGAILNYAAGERVIPTYVPTLGFDITIQNCIFENNYALEGGAVYTFHGGNPTFDHVTFSNNSALYGGATMDRAGVNAIYTDCVFESNDAQYKGGASFTDYGAMATFIDCTLTANNAGSNGGALYVIDRASQEIVNETDFATIDPTWSTMTDIYSAIYTNNCFFSENTALTGNDIYLYDGSYGKLVNNTYDTSEEEGVVSIGSHIVE